MARLPLSPGDRPDADHPVLSADTPDGCEATHAIGDRPRFGIGDWYCTRDAHPEDPFHEAATGDYTNPTAEIVATWTEVIYSLEDDFREIAPGTPPRTIFTDA